MSALKNRDITLKLSPLKNNIIVSSCKDGHCNTLNEIETFPSKKHQQQQLLQRPMHRKTQTLKPDLFEQKKLFISRQE